MTTVLSIRPLFCFVKRAEINFALENLELTTFSILSMHLLERKNSNFTFHLSYVNSFLIYDINSQNQYSNVFSISLPPKRNPLSRFYRVWPIHQKFPLKSRLFSVHIWPFSLLGLRVCGQCREKSTHTHPLGVGMLYFWESV